MIPKSSNWKGVRFWSRSIRLTVYTIAVILTVTIMAACGGILEFVVLKCQQWQAMWPAVCSKDGLTTLQALSLVLLAIVSVRWVLFLTRVLAIRKESSFSGWNSRNDDKSLDARIEMTQLPFGQVLMAGSVEAMEATYHRVTIQEVDLRFWGGYALRSGWIRVGDRVVVVYQRLLGLNYVMVLWNGGDNPIRMVGISIHAFFLLLAIAGVTLLPALKLDYPFWLVPTCAILFVVSSAYLLLVIRARRALRDVISSAV